MDATEKEIQDKIDNIILGKVSGWTYGFGRIDDLAGRLEIGQVVTIVGWTGTGKSYFVLNMIKNIFEEWTNNKRDDYVPPNIIVFTTEMDETAYNLRYICMKAGIYFSQYKKYPQQYHDQVQKSKDDFYADKYVKPNFLQIFPVSSLEEIENILNRVEIKPNIVFIDFVQGLSVNNKSDNKDTMPIIGNRVRDIAKIYNIALICISQMNVSAISKNNDPKQGNVQPSSWGKELMQSSHTALCLARSVTDGVADTALDVGVIKAREGEKGWMQLYIKLGYNLADIL